MAGSTSIDARNQNGSGDLHSPRARKPTRIDFLRPHLGEELLQANAPTNGTVSGVSRSAMPAVEIRVYTDEHSGRTTPIPADAPPSVQASSSARRQIRAQQKQRMFPTIEYVDRVSHFDPTSDYRDFRGFFVLFWIGLAIMVFTTMLRNLKDTGYPFSMRQTDLFTDKIWELFICDGAMVASAMLSLPLQKLYMRKSGLLRWDRLGMAIQSVFQAVWLAFWTSYVFVHPYLGSC